MDGWSAVEVRGVDVDGLRVEDGGRDVVGGRVVVALEVARVVGLGVVVGLAVVVTLVVDEGGPEVATAATDEDWAVDAA